jgi:hypothetical protein
MKMGKIIKKTEKERIRNSETLINKPKYNK